MECCLDPVTSRKLFSCGTSSRDGESMTLSRMGFVVVFVWRRVCDGGVFFDQARRARELMQLDASPYTVSIFSTLQTARRSE